MNAIYTYWPATVSLHGVQYALNDISRGGFISRLFHEAINAEFRKLTERNWEPLA